MNVNTKIALTGAAGFIGARMVEHYQALGWPFVAIDHLPHFSRPEHQTLDFGQPLSPAQFLQTSPEIGGIIHLGACTDTTCLDTSYLTQWNLNYSKALWEHATRKKIPFIYASSAATYGDGSVGYDDDESKLTQLKPLNPYGESKHQFDLWVLEQEKKGLTPSSWAGFKFFNVYGFGEAHKERMSSVVYQAFHQIQQTGKLKLFKSNRPDLADGDQRRDFIYVEDVVRVLTYACQNISRGIYNLGSGQSRSFIDLSESCFAALHRPKQIEFIDMPPGLSERYQNFTEAKMEKLKKAGYRTPFTALEEGVSLYYRRLTQTQSQSPRDYSADSSDKARAIPPTP